MFYDFLMADLKEQHICINFRFQLGWGLGVPWV